MTSSKKFQTSNLILISLSHNLHDIYSSFLAPLRPLLIEKFGISLSVAALWDLFQRIPWLLNPLIGIIAEKTAARYFIIVTPAITAVTMSLLGVAPTFTIVSILLFVSGISGALFHVPAPVMVKKISGDRTGKGMSFYMFGGEMARTIGPLVITGAVSLWGLQGTWKLIPFGLVASFILYLRLRKIKISSDFQKNAKQTGFWKTFKKYLPFFLILIGITFFRAIMKSGLSAFLPTYYFTEKGETLWFANSALSIFQLAGAIGTLVSGTVSDKIGRKTSLLIIAIVTPFLMYLFISSKGLLSFPFLILLGFFIFAPGPVLLALVQDIGKEKPVFINSIFMTISFITASLSVVFAGLLGDWIGLENTYKLSAFLAVGAIPFVLMLKSK
ncbi:MAG: MFS transporter [Bacteroidetes bacterium]|nr:MFS transporter [Bacteroidota bacterium]MBL7103116.1 MFS transporter [Bacteroidales bacterium]